jgi:GTP pyrophosphokinase
MRKKYIELEEQIKEGGLTVNMYKVKKAYEFSELAHTGQKRFSGEDYVEHSLEVARILASWGLDEQSIIAAILHDTIEDGGAKPEDLVKEFGADVALLVDGVTKVTNVRWQRDTEEYFVENLRKMVLFMAKDIRVILIKIADRLHNMRTLSAVPKEKQPRIAKETLEVYAPLAERLGMGEISGELNDLSFKYLYSKQYEELLVESKPYYKTAKEEIKKMKRVLLRRLKEQNINAEVSGREKKLYSLWKKLERKGFGRDFEKIHDIVALRVIVGDVPECYSALGVVHSCFKPAPNLGISDFIAQPKPNGYMSIHTKVFGMGGRIIEVQIRSEAMHEQAEYGVAAHWAYAQAKSKGTSDKELEERGVKVEKDKLIWVKQLVEWQNEIADSKEFLDAVKFDAFNNRNFVFSPKGDVYDLPSGATPVDFAYAVHTDLPEYINGAKVNGRIVPLNYDIQSGDVVEIIKSKHPHPPNRDWLRFVVTNSARRRINKQLRKGR